MSQFVLIDGNNLYIQSREKPREFELEEGHRRVPHPCLEAVESVVDHCVRHGIDFKLYFDSTSWRHYDWWARQAGDAGRELQRRYQSLCALGEDHIKVAPAGTGADMFKLAEADALRWQGIDARIVTRDKFRDRIELFPDLLVWNDKLDCPDCCLPFNASKINGERALVFARLPMPDGHLHEVRIPILAHPDLASRIEGVGVPPPRPAPGPAPAPASVPGPKERAPTLVVERIANVTVGGLRLWGNGQVYSLGLRRSALLEAEEPAWPITVGRSDDQDLVVSESFPSVSRRQLVFDRDAATGRTVVTDSGSSNGTWLNGQKLAAGVATQLPEGPGLITMVGSGEPGSLAVHLFYENGAAQEGNEESRKDDEDASVSETSAPVLHVRLAGGRQLSYEIRSLPFTVGTAVTGEGASLDFPEVISVSREHLQIVSATGDEGFLVRPLGRNGTWFKGAPQAAPFVLPYAGEVVLSPKDAQTGNVAVWITRS